MRGARTDKRTLSPTAAFCPGLIKQFLTDVEWGELDFLIIDSALTAV